MSILLTTINYLACRGMLARHVLRQTSRALCSNTRENLWDVLIKGMKKADMEKVEIRGL